MCLQPSNKSGVTERRSRGSSTANHLRLRGYNFGKWTLHKDDLVITSRRQGEQQLGDHFHCTVFRFSNAGGIFRKLFNPLPFVIAAGIVDVGSSLAVGEDGHASS